MEKHYFVKPINRNDIIILSGDEGIDINGWTQFTDEQENYYRENPNASTWEIKNLREVASETAISVDKLKEQAINNISQYSFDTLHKYVKDYQILNAQCSIRANGENTFYCIEKANQILDMYEYYGVQCRNIYYQFIDALNNCFTEDDVNKLYENTIDDYDAIKEYDQ